jgi:hypothetical protein
MKNSSKSWEKEESKEEYHDKGSSRHTANMDYNII